MLRFAVIGGVNCGEFSTLTESTRTSNSLLSVILTRLIRFTSNPSSGGPSIHPSPRVPTCPGSGFTSRRCPWESVMALLLKDPLSPFSDETPAPGGLPGWKRPGKEITPWASLVTFPVLLGKTPTVFGVLLVVGCQIV